MSAPPTQFKKADVRVGFVGLGLMGSHLTRRLYASGWSIQAWNRSPQPAKEIQSQGIAIAASVAELVAGSDVILSSLANDAAVQSVYFDKGGVFSAVEPGTVILEMSTISPELSRDLHREARTKGGKPSRCGHLWIDTGGRGGDSHAAGGRSQYL